VAPNSHAPWLRMGRTTGHEADNLYLHWQLEGEELDDAGNYTTIDSSMLLRSSFRAASLGHLLRDNFQALVGGAQPITQRAASLHAV
jgi:hypothetical protein